MLPLSGVSRHQALQYALPFLPVRGLQRTLPFSFTYTLFSTSTTIIFSISIRSSFDLAVVSFDGLHVPFFPALFLPSGFRHSFRIHNTPSAESVFVPFFLFTSLDHQHGASNFDHYHYLSALVQHLLLRALSNHRPPHTAPCSITFVQNPLCPYATFEAKRFILLAHDHLFVTTS